MACGGSERDEVVCVSRCTLNSSDSTALRACRADKCHFKPPQPVAPASPPHPVAATERPDGFPGEIPSERSAPPTVTEWASAEKVELEPKGCFRKVVCEWLEPNCSRDDQADPLPQSLAGTEGFGREGAMVSVQLATRSISTGYDWSGGGSYPRIVWE